MKDDSQTAPKRPILVPVFSHDDYREYLQAVVDANPEWRAFKKNISTAAGCTQSFLTQVLSGNASFSFDHLHGIAAFLGLGSEEWAFLRELAVAEKCATPATRGDAMRRAEEIRSRHGAGIFSATPAIEFDANSIKATVYSLLHWDVFHLLGAPKFGTPEQLAARFGVSRERIVGVLKDWDTIGLVERGTDGIWRCKAVRFQTTAAMRSSISTMYQIRSLARCFEGTGPLPKYAAIRLRKSYVAELEKKIDELFEEAWKLAAASEADGDQPVFLTVGLERN